MKNITELIMDHKAGKLTFNELLTAAAELEPATRYEEADGEIWWDGENWGGYVDILCHDDIITYDEYSAILHSLGSEYVKKHPKQ